MDKRVLIIEDEFSINDILTIALKTEGYEVMSTFDGKSGLEAIEKFEPHLILLDLMLPDMSGFDICKQISRDNLVIMITARDSIFDKILGLEIGADDYITKPFEIREVTTRIKVLFRSMDKQKNKEENTKLQLKENIEVDILGERVFKNEEEIEFKRKERALFFHLLNNRNRVYTRDELLNEVWGYEYAGDTRTVDVHVRRIRDKMNMPGDSIIETVFGTGYVMR